MSALITDPYGVHTSKKTIEIPYVTLGTYINAAGLHARDDAELGMQIVCAFSLGSELLGKVMEGYTCWLIYPGKEPEPYEMPRVAYAQLWGSHSITLTLAERFCDQLAYYARQVLGLKTADDSVASMLAHYLLLQTIKPHNGCVYIGEKPH